MKQTAALVYVWCVLACCGCTMQQKKEMKTFPRGSFGYDLHFLQKYDSNLVVLSEGNARVIVSAQYQGKVFTSSAMEDDGISFGWINYNVFEGNPQPHMNGYGGENRLWLGPEGGPFSLFFSKGEKMEFVNWETPAPFDTEPWQLLTKDRQSVHLQKGMQLTNYAGTALSLTVDRIVRVAGNKEIADALQLKQVSDVSMAGFFTQNTITNTGKDEWTDKTGMPCIWMLDMFPPSDSTTIAIPFIPGPKDSTPATTNYFGEIPVSRIRINDSTLFYRADGTSRGKLGIHPTRAERFAGSYDDSKKVLTIILFDINNHAPYLNQEWTIDKHPFSGDAVNAYNDGPLSDGSQMGPFYELESVSPAAMLKPGEKLSHDHAVFHFMGKEEVLDAIAKKTLGCSLEQIRHSLR